MKVKQEVGNSLVNEDLLCEILAVIKQKTGVDYQTLPIPQQLSLA